VGERMMPKILTLIDWPNILKNMPGYNQPVETFSLKLGFDNLEAWFKETCPNAKIIRKIIFWYPKTATEETTRFFEEQGFDVMVCSNKKEDRNFLVKKDPVDEKLIEFGIWAIENIPELTHICIGSGDLDKGRLAKFAKKKGKKIMLVVGSQNSLSSSLAGLIDENDRGKRMIHYFNPLEK
jgi:hypothetical protein